MNRRDKVLLDKQLWGVNPTPPSFAGVALVVMFVSGIIIGSVLFAREHKQTHADPRSPERRDGDRRSEIMHVE
jgi:hypothetical protein